MLRKKIFTIAFITILAISVTAYVLLSNLQSIGCSTIPVSYNNQPNEQICTGLNGRNHYFITLEETAVFSQTHYTYPQSGTYAWLIVTDGFTASYRQVFGGTGAGSRPAIFQYIAIGTGTTAAAISQQNLITELCNNGWTRSQATYSEPSTVQVQITLTFTSSDSTTRAITESGIFNTVTTAACSSNTTTGCTTPCMYARQTFSAVNVANGESETMTWKITVAQG